MLKPYMKDRDDSCCTPFEKEIEVDSLAVAYVPMQKICDYLEPKKSLIEGTVFPSLTGLYTYFWKE